MLVMLILFIELLSVFLCVFRVYGQKPKVDVKGIIAFGMMFAILNIINYFELNSIYSFVAYLVLLIYCKIEFKENIPITVVSMAMALIITTIIQFLCAVFLSFIPTEHLLLRTLCGDVITLCIVLSILRICKIEKLRLAISRRHWLTYLIFFFLLFVIMLILTTIKVQSELQLGLYIFGVPAMIIILFLVIYWDHCASSERKVKNELSTMQAMQENYDDLIDKVKINQHGLKNHMTAILSSHHVCETYEQLVKTQQEYFEIIKSENKYNNLLLISDNIISGFLYGKFVEIEDKGIEVEYKITATLEAQKIKHYYLIEILGILFDNAVEAVIENQDNRKIFFEFSKIQENYKFTVKNPYHEVLFEEKIKWFEMGVTTKKDGQGIGLYRVKEICKNKGYEIVCENENINGINWIVMEIIGDFEEDAT